MLFLREHNRIADVFIRRTNWNADKIFQETRKIINGILQNIVYREFLPLLLGENHMRRFGLKVKSCGHHTVYSDGVNPGSINSFGAAAFRMGHSLVRNEIKHANCYFKPVRTFRTKDTFLQTSPSFSHGCRGTDRFARWMSSETQNKADRFIVDDVRDNLFPMVMNGKKSVLDLAALNTQRGRDHGLPGYNTFREKCRLRRACHFGTGWGGLIDHTKDVADKLKKLYK